MHGTKEGGDGARILEEGGVVPTTRQTTKASSNCTQSIISNPSALSRQPVRPSIVSTGFSVGMKPHTSERDLEAIEVVDSNDLSSEAHAASVKRSK